MYTQLIFKRTYGRRFPDRKCRWWCWWKLTINTNRHVELTLKLLRRWRPRSWATTVTVTVIDAATYCGSCGVEGHKCSITREPRQCELRAPGVTQVKLDGLIIHFDNNLQTMRRLHYQLGGNYSTFLDDRGKFINLSDRHLYCGSEK